MVPTGLRELDDLLEGGLRRGQLSVIGGVSGVGTSMLALNIAANASIIQSQPTVVVAPDSSRREVLARLVAAEAKVPVSHLRGGRLSDHSRQRLQRKLKVLREAPLYVSAGFPEVPDPDEVVAAIEGWVGHGLRLAVVDGTAVTHQQGPELVRALKFLAQRSNIAVVLVMKVQTLASRVGEPPQLEDLGDYPEVVGLLDLVIFLHRDDVHNPKSARPGEADLETVKHRYGPTRRIVVAFQGHYARFVDMTTHPVAPL